MPELIDKHAALKKMCESCGYCERFEKAMRTTHPDFVTDKCNHYKFLAESSTIEAEPVRHGRWVHHNGGYSDHFECTYCGEDIVLTGKWRFCPNCGADMREGVENDA